MTRGSFAFITQSFSRPQVDLCLSEECSSSSLPFEVSEPSGLGYQCPLLPVVTCSPVHFSTFSSDPSSHSKNQDAPSSGDSGSSMLASSSMVPGNNQPGSGSPSLASNQARPINSGSLDSSQPRSFSLDSLAFEQPGLAKKGYSEKVLSTMLASR